MRGVASFLALAGYLLASAAAATDPADSAAEKARCESLGKWTPVHLTTAGIEAALPCSEAEVAAWRAADPVRQQPGIAACEHAGRTFHIIYAVNTPRGFFDSLVARSTSDQRHSEVFSGHRLFRESSHDPAHAMQLIEIDDSRSVIMSAAAAGPADADFQTVSGCFLNALGLTQ